MCGRLNMTDDPFVIGLIRQLGVESPIETVRWGRFKRATDTLTIVKQIDGKNYLMDATWWLLLDQTDDGFKPSRYTSFNTRYDKLNVPRSAGYIPYRQSRCIIPAKGFGETEFKDKKPVHYYDMEAIDGQALAFGGLAKQYIHPHTGEIKTACSVITLPPHEKLSHIHSKAMPLILPQDDSLLSAWLDNDNQNVAMFDALLKPQLPQSLVAYPIDKPSQHQAIAEPELIAQDE